MLYASNFNFYAFFLARTKRIAYALDAEAQRWLVIASACHDAKLAWHEQLHATEPKAHPEAEA